jgi:hypothetical protein
VLFRPRHLASGSKQTRACIRLGLPGRSTGMNLIRPVVAGAVVGAALGMLLGHYDLVDGTSQGTARAFAKAAALALVGCGMGATMWFVMRSKWTDHPGWKTDTDSSRRDETQTASH